MINAAVIVESGLTSLTEASSTLDLSPPPVSKVLYALLCPAAAPGIMRYFLLSVLFKRPILQVRPYLKLYFNELVYFIVIQPL